MVTWHAHEKNYWFKKSEKSKYKRLYYEISQVVNDIKEMDKYLYTWKSIHLSFVQQFIIFYLHQNTPFFF